MKSEYFRSFSSLFSTTKPLKNNEARPGKIFCAVELYFTNQKYNMTFYDDDKQDLEKLRFVIQKFTSFTPVEEESCLKLLQEALGKAENFKNYTLFASFY